MILNQVQYRREQVFWVLSGVFLASMTLLNVIGITKFVTVFGLSVAVGILPYPLTFLCTDIISEVYGKKRANFIVFLGLGINIFILFYMWLGDTLSPVEITKRPPWQDLNLGEPLYLPNGDKITGSVTLFKLIYSSTSGAVVASMVAYMTAQFFDVYIFHYIKKLTKGKHLWLRNNLSTLASQLIDSTAVIGITFGAVFYRGEITVSNLTLLFFSNYAFKAAAALFDTPFFYLFSIGLKKHLKVDTDEI